jgi:hypothetical protein
MFECCFSNTAMDQGSTEYLNIIISVLGLIILLYLFIQSHHHSPKKNIVFTLLHPEPQPRHQPMPNTEPKSPTMVHQNMVPRLDVQNQHMSDKNKNNSIEPEIETLRSLVSEFKFNLNNPRRNTDPYMQLITAGDVYARGGYPRFVPNEEMALQLFRIASMYAEGHTAGMAQMRFIETREYPLITQDRVGRALDPSFGESLCMLATQYNKMNRHVISAPQNKPKIPQHWLSEQFNTNNVNNNNQVEMTGGRRRLATPAAVQQVNNRVAAVPVTAGAQNVHDHAVVQIMKKNVHALHTSSTIWNNTHNVRSGDEVEAQVIDQVLTDPELSPMEKEHALAVIARLGADINDSMGLSEMDALTAVWNHITNGSVKDKQLQKTLKNTLGKQLASGVENGHVVCSTGRFGRIYATLDGIETTALTNRAQIRPMAAVKVEIGTLASHIRDTVMKEASPMEVEVYNNSQGSTILAERMKREFNRQVDIIYVKELGLNKILLQPIMQPYIDAF